MTPPTVFVTGASSGLGAEIVRRFADDGALVVRVLRTATERSTFHELRPEFEESNHELAWSHQQGES